MYGGYFTTSGTFSFVVYQDIIINGLYETEKDLGNDSNFVLFVI